MITIRTPVTKPIAEIFSTAANSGFAFQSEMEEEVRGEQGERGTGEGGWEVGGKGQSLLVKSFHFSMSETAAHFYNAELRSFNIAWHCALSRLPNKVGEVSTSSWA